MGIAIVMNKNVYIVEIPREKIDEIEPLWKELNFLHYEKSSHFKDHFASFTFEERRNKLLHMERIVIFAAKTDAKLVGYCVASINGKRGEIDSLYLKNEYHGKNIGRQLTEKAMNWLNAHNCSEINVYVAQGNEVALPFYEQFGFKKRFHVLQIKNS